MEIVMAQQKLMEAVFWLWLDYRSMLVSMKYSVYLSKYLAVMIMTGYWKYTSMEIVMV